MGLNSYPHESKKGGFLGGLILIVLFLGFCLMFGFGVQFQLQEQKKFDDFIGKKVLIKYNQFEGVIIEAPSKQWLSFNQTHWGVEYIDTAGNKQQVYCLNDEIELLKGG